MTSITETLKNRQKKYGDFSEDAWTSQGLKNVIRSHPKWNQLEDIHKEALEYIVNKISRILSGDPNYSDNWHDIQGYAKLVEDRLD